MDSRILCIVALLVNAFLPVGGANHDWEPCVITSADPGTINQVDVPVTGQTFYNEERDSEVPNNPPIPLSGFVTGNGTWIYEEVNGLTGLQRGGVGFNENEDPITDETCGHGGDGLVVGGVPNLPAVPAGSFHRVDRNEPITWSGFAGCDVSASHDSAEVYCDPGSDARCLSPGILITAMSGGITGITGCDDSPHVGTYATGPFGSGHAIEPGVFSYPWTCRVDFEPRATGHVVCSAPDP